MFVFLADMPFVPSLTQTQNPKGKERTEQENARNRQESKNPKLNPNQNTNHNARTLKKSKTNSKILPHIMTRQTWMSMTKMCRENVRKEREKERKERRIERKERRDREKERNQWHMESNNHTKYVSNGILWPCFISCLRVRHTTLFQWRPHFPYLIWAGSARFA